MANFVFPVNCDGYLDITSSFGHPYPADLNINAIDFYYMVSVVRNIFEKYKNNTQIIQQAGIQNLNTHFQRIAFLRYIYRTNSQDFAKERNLLKSPISLKIVSFHPGIDINKGPGNSDAGEPVYAVYDGVVIGSSPTWGQGIGGYVILNHKGKNFQFFSLYGHINPSISSGQTVKRGTLIGTLSNTVKFPSHLHFEISLKNIYINSIIKYPGYPYNQKKLNLAYLASYNYQNIVSYLTNNIIPSFFCVPNKEYYEMIVDPKDPFPYQASTTLDSAKSAFAREYGFVDPIEFLKKLGCDKFFKPPKGVENNQICSNINKQVENQVCFRRSF